MTPHAAGGGWGGVMERDRQRVQRQLRARRFLHFFHGTSWEVARTIPGQVRPAGGGDFAAGFYTHHDRSDARAKRRAKVWGMRIARERKEPYAGVLDFTVPTGDFAGLLGRAAVVHAGDHPAAGAADRAGRAVTGTGRRRPELDRLIEALDELARQEQVEFEAAERYPEQPRESAVEDGLRDLAGYVTPDLLDALERVPGYASWVLRLSALVPGDDPRARAQRYRDDPSARVRYWAARLRGDAG